MRDVEEVEKRRVPVERCGELSDKTVHINRVAKVVKGGRRFSFSALVVTGDGEGHVGVGIGKASEVPEAIRKASERARKRIIKIPLHGSTIPRDVMGRFGAARVVLKPASPGTGVIAGSAVRAIVDATGIKDIRTKCVGSNNPGNVLNAVLNAFLELDDPETVAAVRGISLDELGYAPY